MPGNKDAEDEAKYVSYEQTGSKVGFWMMKITAETG